MPKTNEKDAYFFSHDCNARNDPKILALRSVYGAEGYGVYFMLVEILREQPDYKLAVNKYIWSTLAMQMQVEASKLEQIINDCCTEFSENGNTLLVNDGEYLYSASLLRRMGKVDDISNLRREAARKRWENKPCKTSGKTDGCSDDANALQQQSKENKSKQKKTKAAQIALLPPREDRCWAGVVALKDDRGGQIGGGRRQQASTGDKMGALRDLHDAFSGDGGV